MSSKLTCYQKDRVYAELQCVRPFRSTLGVMHAKDPSLDAWRGARLWSLSDSFKASRISRKMYEEMGSEYIKEHALSNWMLQAKQ